MIGILGVLGLLALIFARVPIALALAASGLCGYAALDGWGTALKMFGREPFTLASAYSLSEFDTFVRHGYAPIALIGNDSSWAQIAREQVEIVDQPRHAGIVAIGFASLERKAFGKTARTDPGGIEALDDRQHRLDARERNAEAIGDVE